MSPHDLFTKGYINQRTYLEALLRQYGVAGTEVLMGRAPKKQSLIDQIGAVNPWTSMNLFSGHSTNISWNQKPVTAMAGNLCDSYAQMMMTDQRIFTRSSPAPAKEPLGAMEWLDQRVNEMRVRL